ncbi:MAG: AAA family ATPase [Pseudorhodobacter sp.]
MDEPFANLEPVSGWDSAAVRDAIIADRADRERRVRRAPPPRPQLAYERGDPVGMDDMPLPPLESYAGEVGPGAGPIIPRAERASRFYDASTLKDKPVPPREWLVPDLVPQKTITLFSGDGGTGKSLLALQLAVAAVAGAGWLEKPVKPGGAIFITAEDDDDELHRRLDDILRAEGLDYDGLGRLTLRSLAGEDALLAVESNMALVQSALFEELDARAAEDSPALIVIDTLADVFPSNENDRAKVRQFVGILRGLALKRQCAVLLLSHPSLAGLISGSGTSGSTAWSNSVRSRLYLSRVVQDGYEPDPCARMLETKKANYGPVGGEIAMKWQAGVFVAEATPTGLDKLAVGAKAERVFLALLRTFAEQGRKVNHAGGPTYAPKLFASHPNAEGVTKVAFKGAMDALLTRGTICIAKEGRPSKERQFLKVSE